MDETDRRYDVAFVDPDPLHETVIRIRATICKGSACDSVQRWHQLTIAVQPVESRIFGYAQSESILRTQLL